MRMSIATRPRSGADGRTGTGARRARIEAWRKPIVTQHTVYCVNMARMFSHILSPDSCAELLAIACLRDLRGCVLLEKHPSSNSLPITPPLSVVCK